MEKIKKHPDCFAILDNVFPMEKDGLRQTPDKCVDCHYKVECLRTAMAKPDGLQVKEEMVDRAYSSGIIGFFERWSKKKGFYRRKSEKTREKGVGDI